MRYSKSKRFFITQPKGFGYAIVDKGEGKNNGYKTLFHTSDKEQALGFLKDIEENHSDFPTPKTDWKPRLLIIKQKHFDLHYLVKSLENLNEISFKFIEDFSSNVNLSKREMGDLYNEEINSECINMCNNEKIRKEMELINDNVKKIKKEVIRYNRLIDEIQKKIDDRDIKGSYDLLSECEFMYDKLQLIDFE